MTNSLQSLENAAELGLRGEYGAARKIYWELLQTDLSIKTRSRIQNDLSAIAAVQGHSYSALLHASRIEETNTNSSLFAHNRSQLAKIDNPARLVHSDSRNQNQISSEFAQDTKKLTVRSTDGEQVKVAILSLLFNWPSTGGGTVHTKELADFLERDGYQVQHIYAVNESFGVGSVTQELGYSATPLHFDDIQWNEATIRQRFQAATDEFSPDWVIVTDSWNTKPLLAEAVRDYPYFLRIAAQECLCPLNNVRMLFGQSTREDGLAPIGGLPPVVQCDENQLESPQTCRDCAIQNSHLSGGLHKAERLLAGFNGEEYPHRLQQVFAQAEGVLAVNPSIAQLIAPHTSAVHVVPSGFDALRFPLTYQSAPPSENRKLRILFAGLREELMKGFHVLQAATDRLWQHRKDFEVWVTGDPYETDPEYFRCIGWQTQQQLTETMVASDFLVFPTVAQEALGRSAVEAMGCGRGVIASRLGGLEWVIEHEKTGLLFEPGDIDDLCLQLQRLLDDANFREKLGRAGHQKFREEFRWEVILGRSYRKFLGPAMKQEVLDLIGASA